MLESVAARAGRRGRRASDLAPAAASPATAGCCTPSSPPPPRATRRPRSRPRPSTPTCRPTARARSGSSRRPAGPTSRRSSCSSARRGPGPHLSLICAVHDPPMKRIAATHVPADRRRGERLRLHQHRGRHHAGHRLHHADRQPLLADGPGQPVDLPRARGGTRVPRLGDRDPEDEGGRLRGPRAGRPRHRHREGRAWSRTRTTGTPRTGRATSGTSARTPRRTSRASPSRPGIVGGRRRRSAEGHRHAGAPARRHVLPPGVLQGQGRGPRPRAQPRQAGHRALRDLRPPLADQGLHPPGARRRRSTSTTPRASGRSSPWPCTAGVARSSSPSSAEADQAVGGFGQRYTRSSAAHRALAHLRTCARPSASSRRSGSRPDSGRRHGRAARRSRRAVRWASFRWPSSCTSARSSPLAQRPRRPGACRPDSEAFPRGCAALWTGSAFRCRARASSSRSPPCSPPTWWRCSAWARCAPAGRSARFSSSTSSSSSARRCSRPT